MNDAGKRAIKDALCNVEDNLYRYRTFAKPDDVTGNDEKVSDVIVALERERDQLIDAYNEALL